MDEVTLELGERREDAEHEPARRRGGVDLTREDLQADAALLQVSDELDDVGQRAPDAVELPYDQRIARTRHLERTGKTRPFGCAPGAGVVVDTLTAGLRDGVALQIEALTGR
jgi:hypothetical protein